MNVAWGGICSSEPPCVAVSVRPSRHTYAAIVQRKAFTVGIAAESQVAAADYTGIVSGRNTDKFADTNLTPVRSTVVDAPYAKEFPLVLACRLFKTVEIGIHTQFIGEIVEVLADDAVLAEDGLPDILKIRPLIFDTAHRGYYGVGDHVAQAFSIGRSIRS